MSKQTIITILLAMVALIGHGQTFTPIVEDSVDFVITGTTTQSLTVNSKSQAGFLATRSSRLVTMLATTSALLWRIRPQILILSLVKPRVVNCNRGSSNVRCVNEPLKMS